MKNISPALGPENMMAVLVISQTIELYSDLKHLLGQDDIISCQVQHWEEATTFFESEQTQLIVLDCPGAGVDGLAVCQAIRARYSGLLVLVSENEDERFHVLALNLGADASLPNLAGVSLITATIKALLRRFAPTEPPAVLNFGKLSVDAKRRDVFIEEQAVLLSTIEFQLFWFLAQKSGCVVSREEIHRELYQAAYNGYDRNIDLYISRIRQKIDDDSKYPRYLKTVRGIGYQFMGNEIRRISQMSI